MFDFEEDIDLDLLFADVKIDDKNMYIGNSDDAVELVALFFQRLKSASSARATNSIKKKVEEIFDLYSEISFDNELEYYQRFMKLCDRLSEREKLRHLVDKTVISLGGKFSAGKSKFINSISGIKDVLPEAQRPTTSIPTYIIHGKQKRITANSVYGYSNELSVEKLKALTHEFYEAYQIGFSAFIESIMIEEQNYSLTRSIALLDTPGYTKYDDMAGKTIISDKQKAFNQLKISDYLIWLVDIESGALTQDDMEFIDSLNMPTPILIVFNKADKRTEEDISQIIAVAQRTIEMGLNTPCFGVTAYSSLEHKEYGNDLIEKFLLNAAKSDVRGNDIEKEFVEVEQELRECMENERIFTYNVSRDIFKTISRTNGVLEIRSLASIWSEQNQLGYKMYRLRKQYDKLCVELNDMISKFLKYGGNKDV